MRSCTTQRVLCFIAEVPMDGCLYLYELNQSGMHNIIGMLSVLGMSQYSQPTVQYEPRFLGHSFSLVSVGEKKKLIKSIQTLLRIVK